MSSVEVQDGVASRGVHTLLLVAGGALALLGTLAVVEENGVAAVAVVTVGLLSLWVVLDFRFAAIAFLALGVLAPTGIALYFGPSVPLLTFQRLTLVALLGGALLHGPARLLRALAAAPRMSLLLGMTGVAAVATVLSNEPALSRREFFSERLIGLPLYFAVAWLVLDDDRWVRRMLWTLAAVTAVVVVLAAAEAVTGRGVVAQLGLLPAEKLQALGYYLDLERRIGLPRVQSVFQHPLQLGAYLVVLVPLLVVLRRHATQAWPRALCTLTLGLALLALVFTWSRGAWLALLLALLLSRVGGVRPWLILGGGVAVFAAMWATFGSVGSGMLGYRWWLLKGVAHAAVTHFGFGTGPGTFATSVIVRVAGTSEPTAADALAYSLTMLIEAGPIFVVLLWWFVVGFLRDAARARRRALALGRQQTADVLGALRAGVLANLLLSVFSTSLFGTTEGLFISLVLLAVIGRLARGEGIPGEAQ